MARSRTDELLEGWKMVAHSARKPAEAPRPRISRSGLSIGTLAAAAVVIILVIALTSRGSGPGPQPSLPAVGGPSAIASLIPSPAPSGAPATPTTSPAATPSSSPSQAAAASAIVSEYTSDLVKKDYAAAWALLAPDGPSRAQTFAAWSSERGQFFTSVAGRFTVVVSPPDVAPLANWLASPWGASIDVAHALLVEVDYPAVGGNAGYGLYIVNPTATGLQIYDVR